jgi:2-polyprenyl-6-methoxyphenol hydroxylase-like FAD-dependent oxidoreductase
MASGACVAIEDRRCLADCIGEANGDYERAFRRFESARSVRAARVALESPTSGMSAMRMVLPVRQMLGERSEADTFQCLARLYDGLPSPDKAVASRPPFRG